MKITTTMNDFSDWSEITWNEFTDMISNPFNSPSSIREREKNGEDTITACFTLEFLDVHNQNCTIEITLDYEGCDYYFNAWTYSNGEQHLSSLFEQDAKNPTTVFNWIKNHMFGYLVHEKEEVA